MADWTPDASTAQCRCEPDHGTPYNCRSFPVLPAMSRPQHPSLQVLRLDGGRALPPFRIERLRRLVEERGFDVRAITARFVHVVAAQRPLTESEHDTLAALLDYGDAADAALARGEHFIVLPRP